MNGSPGARQRGAALPASDLGVLQPFAAGRLQQLADSIEQQALSDVKSWLVSSLPPPPPPPLPSLQLGSSEN